MTRALVPKNGRRRRQQVTRRAIIAATRRVMIAGNFRPTAKEIVAADGFSARSVHEHFPRLTDLYLAAIDADTARGMIALVPLTDEVAFARVLSLGRIS